MKRRLRHFIFSSYLEDGEKIFEVIRRHILVFKLAAAKTSFFGLVVPGFLWFLIPQARIAYVIWIAVGLLGLSYHYMNWYYDVWLLTNRGIIDIERKGYLDVRATRIEYHLIEDITYTIKGLMQTIFNYGDIMIDKMVARVSVTLKDCPNPKKAERLIKRYQKKYVFERSVKDHDKLKDMLSDMISYHVQGEKINIDKK